MNFKEASSNLVVYASSDIHQEMYCIVADLWPCSKRGREALLPAEGKLSKKVKTI